MQKTGYRKILREGSLAGNPFLLYFYEDIPGREKVFQELPTDIFFVFHRTTQT